MEPTLDEQLAELDREIVMRQRMYPRWISAGTLNQPQADRQMQRLQAARETVRKARQDQSMTGMNGQRIDK